MFGNTCFPTVATNDLRLFSNSRITSYATIGYGLTKVNVSPWGTELVFCGARECRFRYKRPRNKIFAEILSISCWKNEKRIYLKIMIEKSMKPFVMRNIIIILTFILCVATSAIACESCMLTNGTFKSYHYKGNVKTAHTVNIRKYLDTLGNEKIDTMTIIFNHFDKNHKCMLFDYENRS